MCDFAKLKISRELPPAGDYTERTIHLFETLCGAKILDIGAPEDSSAPIEGGGFIIDYVPKGEVAPRRVVFGFNECGMWVEYNGTFTPSIP